MELYQNFGTAAPPVPKFGTAAPPVAAALAAADACAVIDYMYVYMTEFVLIFTTVAHILLQLY